MTNKEIVKNAVTELFIKGDISALDKYWSDQYIQHNPMIDNGRDALKKLASTLGPGFRYEMGMIVGDGDYVMVHGRYTGFGPNPMIAVDMFRVKDGKLAEHWDVLQEEVPADKTASGNPMFATGL